jgi:hypothetical protein
MWYLTLEIRQLSISKVRIDEEDLLKAGLTVEEIERCQHDEKFFTECHNKGRLSSIIPDVVTPDELLSIKVKSKEFDDSEMCNIGCK